jgi:hypothetical protein
LQRGQRHVSGSSSKGVPGGIHYIHTFVSRNETKTD